MKTFQLFTFIVFNLCISRGFLYMEREHKTANIFPQTDDPSNPNDTSLHLERVIRMTVTLSLDIIVVATKSTIELFRRKGVNLDEFLAKMFAEVSKIYIWHNIAVSVAELEKWNDTVQRVDDETNITEFTKYFVSNAQDYDSYVVLSGVDLPNFEDTGMMGKVCSAESITIIKMSQYIDDALMAANTLAHELGHNLGFQHMDFEQDCVCAADDQKFCLMNSKNHKWKGTPKTIETCHIEKLEVELHKYNCLLHRMNKRVFGVCGDGVVDVGEQCDCGFKELCRNLTRENTCCHMKTCKFKKHEYQCSGGQCCRKCKFIKDTVCRTKFGECDYEEYCDGKQSECPKDDVRPNFELCNNDRSFCYDGVCMNHNDLCKYVYNDDEAFFSNHCLNKLHVLLKNACSYSNDNMYKMLCENVQTVCDVFLCATRSHSLFHTNRFKAGNHLCFIPELYIQNGTLELAPNFMKCSQTQDNVCYNGKCTNETKNLFGRKKKDFPGIENKYSNALPKLIALPPNRFGYRVFSSDSILKTKLIPETTVKDKIPKPTVSKKIPPTATKIHLSLPLISLLATIAGIFSISFIFFTIIRFRKTKNKSVSGSFIETYIAASSLIRDTKKKDFYHTF